VKSSDLIPDAIHDKKKNNNNNNNQNYGLINEKLGANVPLVGVAVKGKIVDTVAMVTVFQEYYNENAHEIEAKYVFPLDEHAAVCGFEAFINGKHIIGKVKEKEQAHVDYAAAIAQGHGAYLLDESSFEDAESVFVVQVGNLPSKTTAVIKITYVTELPLQSGAVVQFMIPSTIAANIREREYLHGRERDKKAMSKINKKNKNKNNKNKNNNNDNRNWEINKENERNLLNGMEIEMFFLKCLLKFKR